MHSEKLFLLCGDNEQIVRRRRLAKETDRLSAANFVLDDIIGKESIACEFYAPHAEDELSDCVK